MQFFFAGKSYTVLEDDARKALGKLHAKKTLKIVSNLLHPSSGKRLGRVTTYNYSLTS